MSNLNSNTTALQALLAKANALPEAGSGTGEDLDTEIAEQAELIDTLLTTLDGKASGGGSVEMCTVTLVSNFDAVEELIAGYAYAYTIEEDLSVATETNSVLKSAGEFVDESISITVPKGSVLVLNVAYDAPYTDNNGMFHPEMYTILRCSNFTVDGRAGFFFDGLYAMFSGDTVEDCVGFVIYGDCTITANA